MKQVGLALADAVLAVVVIFYVGSAIRLARADEEVPVYVMPDTEVRELADFASHATRSPKLTAVPALMRAIDPELLQQFCRCHPLGLFVQGMLYIDPGVDLSTAIGKSIALHELTHAVQVANHGQTSDCIVLAAREAEAIRVQNDWLRTQTSPYHARFVAPNCKP